MDSIHNKMEHTARYMALVNGQQQGALATLSRGGLYSLSWVYRLLIGFRNFAYDYVKWPRWLGVPVISVGNLTVGGTGKTPMVLWLCHALLERDFKPGVLSRGYKASDEGLADELLLIARRYPRVVAVANPDRVRAGQLAVEEYGIQAAVLDDGFQHRRLGRDLDIVMIDATRPFGYGHILPRGLLREPMASLRRAHVIVLTRCDQCEPRSLRQVEASIRQVVEEVPIVRAVHRPTGFVDLQGEKVDPPTDGRIGCFAGIAHPEALAETLTQMYLTPTETRWWADHHVYTEADFEAICSWVAEAELDYLVTSEKDAVKLAELDVAWPVPVASLCIRIDLLADGEQVLNDMIDAVLESYEEADECEAEQTES